MNRVRRTSVQTAAVRRIPGSGIFEGRVVIQSCGRRDSWSRLRSTAQRLHSMVKQAASRDVSDAWAAFEGEVLPHADRLFRLAMWFVRNRADAEDVVQDTMMQALKSFHRFQPGTNCRAWLTTILQRIVSNRTASGRALEGGGRSRRSHRADRAIRPARAAGAHRRTRPWNTAPTADDVPGGHPAL